MKFICGKSDLSKAANIASRAISTKLTKNILECLHITASGETLTIEATDTVSAIRTSIYANVIEEGESALPAKVFQEIVGKFPEGEICIERKNQIVMTCSSTQAALSEMDVSLFPDFPATEGDTAVLTQKLLREMIDGVAFSVYQTDDKPVLTGILVEMDGENLKVVGMDGYRLAQRAVDWSSPVKRSIIIPSRIMKDLARVLSDDASEVTLSISERACFFSLGDTVFFTRLIEGEYVKYDTFFPKSCSTRARIETRLFERSLEMLSIFAREDTHNRVRLIIGDDKISLHASSEYGELEDQIPAYTEGDVLTIFFNVRSLLDIIHVIKDDNIVIEFAGDRAPCLIKPLSGDEYKYLLVATRSA